MKVNPFKWITTTICHSMFFTEFLSPNTGSDVMKATNNLSGVEYGFSNIGYEAILLKILL